MYHTEAFETAIFYLQNVTATLINNINSAVEEALTKTKNDNKTVQDYFNELEQIKNNKPEQITSTYNVFIIVLTLISMQICYCMFKVCFTPSHNIKPLFPTQKQRKCTKWSGKHKQTVTNQELAPIQH
jgi:hypothetical protein